MKKLFSKIEIVFLKVQRSCTFDLYNVAIKQKGGEIR
jgi:hypothetical protein